MFAALSTILVELTSQFDLVYDKIEAPLGVPLFYRGSQIRTDDILLPKQTLYQAELHPDDANIQNLKGKTDSEKDFV